MYNCIEFVCFFGRCGQLGHPSTPTLRFHRSCTYYDQLVVCGWCCESFVQMVQDFVDGLNCVLPTAEGLDILLEMCQHAQNVAGIMEFAEELLPLLVLVERVLLERRVDCLPSIISAQLAYVLTAYISHNYYYFLYSPNAPKIVEGLVGLCSRKIEANCELIRRVVPPWKPTTHSGNDKNSCGGQRFAYNASTFKELFDEPKRILSFTEYRRLHAIIDGTDDARYNFVAALAEKHLDWCGAIQALCCSSLQGGASAFPDLLLGINVEDSTCHYNIATFYMLLAGRSCFSMNALIFIFCDVIFCLGKLPDTDAEAGVCLALLILADIICQSDQPIILSTQYTGERINWSTSQADRWILTGGHLHDIGDEVSSLLVTICMIADFTKNKLRDRFSDEFVLIIFAGDVSYELIFSQNFLSFIQKR
ncbi:unnamed protein product [Gongylonema pulchrum]|uniref:RING-type E3 ubiquitin transferase n=1 Tax=Gongylonema pulchrum TaxID=637853 RepID=A0A183DWB2_9BILA|nr:unnamed protein product [Gongylonema pulchrum]